MIKAEDLIHVESVSFKYKKNSNYYVIRVNGLNIFGGFIYFLASKNIWVFEPNSMAVYYPKSLIKICEFIKKLDNEKFR
jgi:hypothetical protein